MFKSWTRQEEDLLLTAYKTLSIEEIAKTHERSNNAIEIRLRKLAVKMFDNNISLAKILEETGVDEESIMKEKSMEAEREKKNKVIKEVTTIEQKNPGYFSKKTIIEYIRPLMCPGFISKKMLAILISVPLIIMIGFVLWRIFNYEK